MATVCTAAVRARDCVAGARKSYLVRAHLLERVNILGRQLIALYLRPKTSHSVLEIYFCPLLDIRYPTVGLGAVAGVGAGLIGSEGVVEAVLLNSDALLVLALERISEEADSKVKSRGEHAVLRLCTEHGDSVGLGEVLEKEAVLDAHGHSKII